MPVKQNPTREKKNYTRGTKFSIREKKRQKSPWTKKWASKCHKSQKLWAWNTKYALEKNRQNGQKRVSRALFIFTGKKTLLAIPQVLGYIGCEIWGIFYCFFFPWKWKVPVKANFAQLLVFFTGKNWFSRPFFYQILSFFRTTKNRLNGQKSEFF